MIYVEAVYHSLHSLDLFHNTITKNFNYILYQKKITFIKDAREGTFNTASVPLTSSSWPSQKS